MMPMSNGEFDQPEMELAQPAPTLSSRERDIVLLSHPHRPEEEPIEVENTGEALTPYMVAGYRQFRPKP